MDKHISTPITAEITKGLHAGDYVYISGTIYVARDAAHKRLAEMLDEVETALTQEERETLKRGEPVKKITDALPFPLENAAIYYMGPSPARAGRPIGSAGPTTASRMDSCGCHDPQPCRIFCGSGWRRSAFVKMYYTFGACLLWRFGSRGSLKASSRGISCDCRD